MTAPYLHEDFTRHTDAPRSSELGLTPAVALMAIGARRLRRASDTGL
jgi:MYXO-CTERM domain-containing protein